MNIPKMFEKRSTRYVVFDRELEDVMGVAFSIDKWY